MLSLNITDATTCACRADKGNRDHPYLELCRIVDSESGKCDRKHTLDYKITICDEGNLDTIM